MNIKINLGYSKSFYYQRVINKEIQKQRGIYFLSAEQEKNLVIAARDTLQNEKIGSNKIRRRILIKKNQIFSEKYRDEIDFISTSKTQIISIATSLIPFLEHNDANRALMASNMQRQAIPLEEKDLCMIETGIEAQIAKESESTLISKKNGIIKYLTTKKIVIKEEKETSKIEENQSITKKICKKVRDEIIHPQNKYKESVYIVGNRRKSNQNTYLQQSICVKKNQLIRKEQVLADSGSTLNGKLALGKNILIGYLVWEGYNFEDAIIISDRLVEEDALTSIHIKKYKTFVKISENGEVRIDFEGDKTTFTIY